jgi:ABC-type nickel/cobalt efflux system permease component RcnA
MGKLPVIILTLLLLFVCASPANAQNPFASKDSRQKVSPLPIQSYPFLARISVWQQQLNQKMAVLIRRVRETKSQGPLLLLILISFVYGVVHAAGPGHGKAVAMSYMVSRDSDVRGCVLLGNFIALFHGLSGIILVLIIHFVLQNTVMGSLESVTRITQIISYSLIALVGMFLLVKNLYSWHRRTETGISSHSGSDGVKRNGPLSTALIVGMIPCPGVVLIMLFAMSLHMLWLGLLLAVIMIVGMAVTISAVVAAGVTGKSMLLGALDRRNKTVTIVERTLNIAAALIVTILGLTFLAATV